MTDPVFDTRAMIAGMRPSLSPVAVAYAVTDALPPAMEAARLIALVREEEGLTLVLPLAEAEALGLRVVFRAAQITLTVHSALEGLGLTAAVAGALARAGVACNVVAGARHDHLFVPWEARDTAMAALEALARDA